MYLYIRGMILTENDCDARFLSEIHFHNRFGRVRLVVNIYENSRFLTIAFS